MEHLLVQILVVVAIIQTRYFNLWLCKALKTVVEKVSLRAALGQGLVGPKDKVNSEKQVRDDNNPKGNQVNIPELCALGM